jgi:hypothetical protein
VSAAISKPAAILVGGFVAGLFDILYATIYSYWYRDVPPLRILQSVASGLLGREAYDGGTATGILGLVLHFFIALCAAAIYLLAAQRMRFLVEKPVLWGSIFGIGVYVFMNYVVIPLSQFPPRSGPPSALTVVTSLIVHSLFFGVPIALASRRVYR